MHPALLVSQLPVANIQGGDLEIVQPNSAQPKQEACSSKVLMFPEGFK